MVAEFIYVRCPHCQQQFPSSAAAARERVRVLMPVLKMLRARCPQCGAAMSIGDTCIDSPAAPAKPAS